MNHSRILIAVGFLILACTVLLVSPSRVDRIPAAAKLTGNPAIDSALRQVREEVRRRGSVKPTVTLTGELDLEITEFPPNPTIYRWSITDKDGKKVTVYPANEDLDQFHPKSKTTFEGILAGGFPVGILRSTDPKNQPFEPYYPKQERKVLVLLFKFRNSMRTYITADELQQRMFGRDNVVGRFFSDISKNRFTYTGDVKGWFYLPRNGDDDNDQIMPCDVSQSEALATVNAAGIDVSGYDTIVHLANCMEYGTVGGRTNHGQINYLGAKHWLVRMAGYPTSIPSGETSSIPGMNSAVSILIHELGHNHTLSHSNGLDCGESSDLYPCTNVEYGNRFDRMGNPGGAWYFSPLQRKKAGWLNDAAFLHVKQSGTYTIHHAMAATGKVGAYIYDHKGEKPVFFLEHRMATGFDSRLLAPAYRNVAKGLIIHSAMGDLDQGNVRPSYRTSFRTIDTNATSESWMADTAYESMTGVWYDRVEGISITSYGPGDGSVTFEVNYGARECWNLDLGELVSKPFFKAAAPITDRPGKDPIVPNGPIDDGGEEYPELDTFFYKQKIKLKPGELFSFAFDVSGSEPLWCPSRRVTFELLEPERWNAWAVPAGTGTSRHATFANSEKRFVLKPLRVPLNATAGIHTFHFQVTENESTEVKTHILQVEVNGPPPR